MSRLFIAIDLPDDVKDELATVQQFLKKRGLIEGSFPRPDLFHLTLKFLGNVSSFDQQHVIDVLSTIQMTRFLARLDAVGAFLSLHGHARIIWAGLEGRGFYELHNIIEDLLCPSFPREERPFKAHLTLMRVKRVGDKKAFIGAMQQLTLKSIAFLITQLVLKRSELNSAGRTYHDVAIFKLL